MGTVKRKDGLITKSTMSASAPVSCFWARWPESTTPGGSGFPDVSKADQSWKWDRVSSSTSDVITYRNSNKKTANACHHVSDQWETRERYVPAYCAYYSDTARYQYYMYRAYPGWQCYGYAPYDAGGAPAPDVPAFVARAVREMAPDIKAEMSSLVSLWEIKDVVNLPKSFAKVASLLKSALRAAPGMSFRKLIKAWANGQLTWSFGVKPLMNDVHAIMNACDRVYRALLDLQSRAGKVQVRHYSETSKPYSVTKNLPDVWSMSNSYGGQIHTTWTLLSVCTMKYVYWLRTSSGKSIDINDPLTRLTAYADYAGIRLDPGVIWDIIPFSFVVDWFIDVGGWLSSHSGNGIQPFTEVIDCMWSTKITSNSTAVSNYYGCTSYAYGNPPPKEILLGSVDYTRNCKTYHRERCIPPPQSLFGDSPTIQDFNAWKLGLALVVSR